MPRFTLEQILVENSTYACTHRLKLRLIKDGLLEEACAKCGNRGEWMATPLSLHLDHVNGRGNDHRIENLRLLCPNCHSQTESYGGKRPFRTVQGRQPRPLKFECVQCGKARVFRSNSGLCRECVDVKRRVPRPDVETIRQQVRDFGYRATGKVYGVSDNAIRKWIK